MLRRIAITAALACATVVIATGCGGDSPTEDPLETALAYLPAETPFAASFETDLDGEQFNSLSDRAEELAGADVRGLLESAIDESDADLSFEEDVEPVLGNPVVIGATDVASFLDDASENDFVAAIQAADGEALDRIIERSDAEQSSEVAGATVYDGDFAIDGDVVVFAGSEALLNQALEAEEAGEGLDPETFTESFEELPEDAIADIFFNVEELIDNDPDTQQAAQVPWVGALTTFAMTLSVTDDVISAEFDLRSDGDDLDEEDVPLATGDDAPSVFKAPGAISVGLRDPAHVAAFFEGTFALLEPGDYQAFEAAKPIFADQFGVDIEEDLYGQLTGDVAATIRPDGSFAVRAEVADPDSFAETVTAVAEAFPALSRSGLGSGRVQEVGDFYVARLAGQTPITFGLVDDSLVVAPTPDDAARIAAADLEPLEGAEGSVVARADVGEIAADVIAMLGGEIGIPAGLPGGFFERFGDLGLSIASETDGMRGRLRLDIDPGD